MPSRLSSRNKHLKSLSSISFKGDTKPGKTCSDQSAALKECVAKGLLCLLALITAMPEAGQPPQNSNTPYQLGQRVVVFLKKPSPPNGLLEIGPSLHQTFQDLQVHPAFHVSLLNLVSASNVVALSELPPPPLSSTAFQLILSDVYWMSHGMDKASICWLTGRDTMLRRSHGFHGAKYWISGCCRTSPRTILTSQIRHQEATIEGEILSWSYSCGVWCIFMFSAFTPTNADASVRSFLQFQWLFDPPWVANCALLCVKINICFLPYCGHHIFPPQKGCHLHAECGFPPV